MTSITGCSAVGSAGGLGPSGRGFEPLHSDQKLSEISDFRELFLFLVYCGARGEVAASGIFFLSSAICKPPFRGMKKSQSADWPGGSDLPSWFYI